MSKEQADIGINERNPVEHHAFFERMQHSIQQVKWKIFSLWYLIKAYRQLSSALQQVIDASRQKDVADQQEDDAREELCDSRGQELSLLRELNPMSDKILAKVDNSIGVETRLKGLFALYVAANLSFLLDDARKKSVEAKVKLAQAKVKVAQRKVEVAQAQVKAAQAEARVAQISVRRGEPVDEEKRKERVERVGQKLEQANEKVRTAKQEAGQARVPAERARVWVEQARVRAERARARAEQTFKSFVSDSGANINHEEEDYLTNLLYTATIGDLKTLKSDMASEPTKHLIARNECDRLLLEIIANDDQQGISAEDLQLELHSKKSKYEKSVCRAVSQACPISRTNVPVDVLSIIADLTINDGGKLVRSFNSSEKKPRISPVSGVGGYEFFTEPRSSRKKEKDVLQVSQPPTDNFRHCS